MIRHSSSGRGALISRWSQIGRSGGALSSENAGISNLKTCENHVGRKSKVSRATVIVPGLVGPKPRRISVGDGQQVNIPVLVVFVNSSRRTSRSGFMVYIRPSLKGIWDEWKLSFGMTISGQALARKAGWLMVLQTEPQTNTGARVE